MESGVCSGWNVRRILRVEIESQLYGRGYPRDTAWYEQAGVYVY